MRTVEHAVDIHVFDKEWGREVYIETVEETIQYLNAKGLEFISEKVKKGMRGISVYKEMCISETKAGYVLSVGRCGFESLSYREIYNSEL